MFHAKSTIVFLIVQVFENILVVNFTCCWLIAAGRISQMEHSYFAPCSLNIRNEVTFRNLLVIKVIQQFAGRSVHSPADCITLRYPCEEKSGVINKVVQRLKNQSDTFGFNYIAAKPQVVNSISSLVVNVKFIIISSQNNQSLFNTGFLLVTSIAFFITSASISLISCLFSTKSGILGSPLRTYGPSSIPCFAISAAIFS